MNYEEWEASAPEAFRGDSLWKIKAYRLALFVGDVGWHDVCKLVQDQRTRGLSDQLYRALGSISANLAEGYSRKSSKDKARFYEYALGSARESRDWYFKGRYILGEAVVTHRLDLLTEIIRLLITMVPQQRQSNLREESPVYRITTQADAQDDSAGAELLHTLFQNIPLPIS
ncbi:MAG: four helix bundle protein [Thermoflexales bacterium]|nr:four helix bundle protein [Thermoflexales bacterium]